MLEVLDKKMTKELFMDLEKEFVGVKLAFRALIDAQIKQGVHEVSIQFRV